MRTVRASRAIPAPAERVFDLLSDHANYDRFRGIRRSKLLRKGESDHNGLGALRLVLIGPLRFEEEITGYEPPTALDYLIVKINAPFQHEGGHIRLIAEDGATRAEWTSDFRVPVPIAGRALEPLVQRALAWGFGRVLEDVERMLGEGATG
jgi:ribosome-associated toxin RatA of RatAB toxin-antitoxin module